ncbi:MAG: hypothetical protein ACTS27_01350 [Phycisphaerales bacterium]
MREAFVSPRVVDEDAFARFAGSLKDAASAAKHEREALKADLVEVKRLAGSLDADWGPTGARMKRLAAITKALQGVESRLAKVDDALKRLESTEAVVQRGADLESRLAEMVRRAEQAIDMKQRGLEAFLDERLAAFARGLHERVTGADVRMEQHAKDTERKLLERAAHVENVADQRAQTLRARLEAHLEEAANAVKDLAEVDASNTAKQLERSIERAESLAKSLDARREDLTMKADAAEERLARAAETSMKRLGEHLEGRGEALRDTAEQIERRAEQAAREASEIIEQAERRNERMAMQAETVLEPRLRVLEETLAQAKAMCRPSDATSNDGDQKATLMGLIERGEKVRAGVSQGLRTLGALKDQIEQTSREASASILDAAEQIDGLERRRDDLMRAVREALDLCEITEKSLRARTERAQGD